MCVILFVCWLSGCRSQCNGCMNVAWALLWGRSRSTKPFDIPYKVAAAGDERYFVCAAGAAWIVSTRDRFLFYVLQRVVVYVCVILWYSMPCVCWLSGCRSQCNGCMTVAWALIWGGSRSTKPFDIPCAVAAAGDERYLVCSAGAAWIVSTRDRFLLCVLQRVVVYVCVILWYSMPCVCWTFGCRCVKVAWRCSCLCDTNAFRSWTP